MQHTITIHHLITENTSETLKFRSVLNVDNCLKKNKKQKTIAN